MQPLTFITGNKGKAEQVSWLLHVPLTHKKIDLPEIQSLDLATIVAWKAKEAYQHVQSPVLVEDTSLCFGALGKLPGPLIKWFLAELGTNGLCRLLDSYPDRSAEATVMFGLYDGQALHTFRGSQKGSIALAPRGQNGFGWDSIFIPSGSEKTWAELTIEEQKEASMRKAALEKLRVHLKSL
ncbi:non-canonical purine NTP pyrophosphatase [Dictyobacter aurantiacus]|uniref:Non-canonical purine NTP pyrophosphatase, RdgB/HAM1 family n=1 Tax=Dictyobacter aurantiacus TaxID=1936993 RepID=A0A401ZRM6_9CHLR|nr:non-canonical purine NTP pyrophosphatase [Dictyobacter aurantiacus]GCE09430.1 non-canonical purine NTP pyrophosphatase, RdgB/HAM1 family [Dictyobacter aurantiacus]